MRTLEELEELTKQWSYERGILTNSTIPTQTLKLVSEAGELAGNIEAGKDIKDDIGDCRVVLCNICSISKGRDLTMYDHTGKVHSNIWKYLGDLADDVIKNKQLDEHITNVYQSLNELANDYFTTLEECWNTAYEDIKDRKGFLNEQGNFIKSTDENYQQQFMEFQSKIEEELT